MDFLQPWAEHLENQMYPDSLEFSLAVIDACSPQVLDQYAAVADVFIAIGRGGGACAHEYVAALAQRLRVHMEDFEPQRERLQHEGSRIIYLIDPGIPFEKIHRALASEYERAYAPAQAAGRVDPNASAPKRVEQFLRSSTDHRAAFRRKEIARGAVVSVTEVSRILNGPLARHVERHFGGFRWRFGAAHEKRTKSARH